MTGGPLKPAKDLKPGDRVLTYSREHIVQPMTVLAMIAARQTVLRRVCIVTLRLPNGDLVERRFYPNTAVRLVDSP